MKGYSDKERDKQCLALCLEQDAILGKIWVQLEKRKGVVEALRIVL